MRNSKVFLSFSFFMSFLFAIMVTSEANCTSKSACSDSETEVRFPFSLESDPKERCAYPGFDLSCDRRNRTVIQLGSWGEFLVRNIDYSIQEVQVYDQNNCLPKRLLNVNISDSPFQGAYTRSVDFFNCSSDVYSGFLEPISCLSGSNYSVYATPYMSRSRFQSSNSCELFESVVVPIWPVNERRFFADINDDLHLFWGAPNCGDCVEQGGQCGFENSKSDEIACYNLPVQRGVSRAVKYILSIGVGIPSLMILVLIACYACGRFKSLSIGNNIHRRRNLIHDSAASSVLPQPTICMVGLDEAVLQSYPKTVLGESRRLPKPDDNTCPICLSEYQPKDTLRTIPECKHCFHADCIDEWLHKNITCPLCRNSPSPLKSPV